MTTLVAQGARSGAALHWSVQLGDDELLPDGEGRTRPVAQFLFEHVGREFAISLTERAGSAGSRFASSTVMCKYVRREIRELSDEDRDAYLSALEVVARDAPEALDAARTIRARLESRPLRAEARFRSRMHAVPLRPLLLHESRGVHPRDGPRTTAGPCRSPARAFL